MDLTDAISTNDQMRNMVRSLFSGGLRPSKQSTQVDTSSKSSVCKVKDDARVSENTSPKATGESNNLFVQFNRQFSEKLS